MASSASDVADPSTALGKRRADGHEDDDLDALESLSSSTTSVPASCKRPHLLHPAHSTYQEGALTQLRDLFGERADDALIESVYYNQCDEDSHKAIARLVAATGLHPELVQQQTHSRGAQEEEKQEETKSDKTDAQPSTFVSCSSPPLCALPYFSRTTS